MSETDRDKTTQTDIPLAADYPITKEIGEKENDSSTPPGLREIRLTEEEAELLRQILDAPNKPTFSGKEMPSADPCVLFLTLAAAALVACQTLAIFPAAAFPSP
jgi:hypothetical protein